DGWFLGRGWRASLVWLSFEGPRFHAFFMNFSKRGECRPANDMRYGNVGRHLLLCQPEHESCRGWLVSWARLACLARVALLRGWAIPCVLHELFQEGRV